MKKNFPAWIVLCVITLIAGLLLGITNDLTQDKIAEQSAAAANAARLAVLPGADTFEAMELSEDSGLDSCYAGYDAQGGLSGYASQVTVNGYGGEIEIIAGMDMSGALKGISVGGANFSETAGLGARTKEAEFTDQFKELAIEKGKGFQLKSDIDAVTGATISSSAVVSGVNKLCQYMIALLPGMDAESSPTPKQVGEAVSTQTVTVKGYGGDVEITLGLAEDGSVASLQIGGENFAETDGLGALAKESAFTDQFLGKTGPFAYGTDGIDAISGATVTSTAVLGGINGLYGK